MEYKTVEADTEESLPFGATYMAKRSEREAPRLRELWSLQVKIGRFSLFVGLGEVQST